MKYLVGSEVEVVVHGTVIDDGHGQFAVQFPTRDGQKWGNAFPKGDVVVHLLREPKQKFQPGKGYGATVGGVTWCGVRTSFGKWAVTNHPDRKMVGEVLTDAAFCPESVLDNLAHWTVG